MVMVDVPRGEFRCLNRPLDAVGPTRLSSAPIRHRVAVVSLRRWRFGAQIRQLRRFQAGAPGQSVQKSTAKLRRRRQSEPLVAKFSTPAP